MRNEDKVNLKIKEYSERNSFWTGQVLKQFGFSLNLFFATGIGFLAFLIKQREDLPEVCFKMECQIHGGLVIYYLSAFFVFFSVVLGSISVLSRLFDLRLTRHTIWIRKKSAQRKNKIFNDDYLDIKGRNIVANFFSSMLGNDYFIQDKDFEEIQLLEDKFVELRIRNLLLGRLSWKCHLLQVAFLTVAVVIFSFKLL